ncbi:MULTISPECIES: copper-binding protein [unclassified Polaromonas]|uniref:copper-binding protein n=1 Tax=unclassified Polaromonas TaxID=2638319 RepID=UPI000F099CD4|nr:MULTISPECIES: copper-binding protein [unclassified Polaromonas]AYQ28832.1 RND transporter [Polaromonas sp. SP1]QGJ20051.1 RND transporter [Polaromonas sp. Pch-P]
MRNSLSARLHVAVFMAALLGLTANTHAANPADSKTEVVKAQVVKVDAGRGKVTLRHAPIKSIGMEAMTMPFKVKDAALLEAIKAGDKVTFSVATVDDELVVTRIQVAK